MTLQELASLLLFAFVLSITPGPNNLMLMASGANFGFRRSLGHILGVGIGLLLMMIIMGAGLMQTLDRFPKFGLTLQIVSVFYLLYLAWKIANSASPEAKKTDKTPISFIQAAAFQWVNPKAWAMAMTSITLHAPSNSLDSIVLVALIFAIVHIPCISCWNLLGREIRRIITKKAQLRIFNGAMAAMLLASLAPLIIGMNADAVPYTLNGPVVVQSVQVPAPPEFTDVVWLDLEQPWTELEGER